jgi:hypothetical protein
MKLKQSEWLGRFNDWSEKQILVKRVRGKSLRRWL